MTLFWFSFSDKTSGGPLTVHGNERSATVRGLRPKTRYFFRVKCLNALGESQYGAEVAVTTLEERSTKIASKECESFCNFFEKCERFLAAEAVHDDPDKSFMIPLYTFSINPLRVNKIPTKNSWSRPSTPGTFLSSSLLGRRVEQGEVNEIPTKNSWSRSSTPGTFLSSSLLDRRVEQAKAVHDDPDKSFVILRYTFSINPLRINKLPTKNSWSRPSTPGTFLSSSLLGRRFEQGGLIASGFLMKGYPNPFRVNKIPTKNSWSRPSTPGTFLSSSLLGRRVEQGGLIASGFLMKSCPNPFRY
ncbi:uncharacterized protein CDAR_64061 [Caerostris darwini]|uniref:Fibronectin type-III domain-containing protein n=1 Tax=Caerostris darwini TaxID=1538125 RepID=A0AAV4N7S8_9ARAC|nr:uncharacterized protein CDAR_64061 [Caerostris darwini]